MTTSPSPGATSPSTSSGASPSSLPRWRSFLQGACNTARHFGATLNWRRDPGYEQSIVLHEQRMKQIESEILRVRSAGERSKERTKLIEKEIEQLDHENAKLKALNASIKRLCFPPESSSIPQSLIEPDSKPSLPS
jgi:hypothetical protein